MLIWVRIAESQISADPYPPLFYCTLFRQGHLTDEYDDIEPFFELKSNAAAAAAALPATDTSFSASFG
jgi:hypothetical protein